MSEPTYTILQFDGRADAIKCLLCGRVSHNLIDVEERYCAHCHVFHLRPYTGATNADPA